MTFTPRYTSDGTQYYDERTNEHPYSFIDVTDASLGFNFKGEFKNASEGENSSFEFGAGKTITIKVNPENKESKAEVVKTSEKAVQGGRQGIAYAIDVNVSGTNDPTILKVWDAPGGNNNPFWIGARCWAATGRINSRLSGYPQTARRKRWWTARIIR